MIRYLEQHFTTMRKTQKKFQFYIVGSMLANIVVCIEDQFYIVGSMLTNIVVCIADQYFTLLDQLRIPIFIVGSTLKMPPRSSKLFKLFYCTSRQFIQVRLSQVRLGYVGLGQVRLGQVRFQQHFTTMCKTLKNFDFTALHDNRWNFEKFHYLDQHFMTIHKTQKKISFTALHVNQQNFKKKIRTAFRAANSG